MRALTRLPEFVFCPACDDFFAEIDERRQDVLKIHLLRPPIVQGQHIDGKIRLQRRMRKKLVQNHFRHRVALQFNHNAHAVPVGFVAQLGYAFDDFFMHAFRNALNKRFLIQLIRNFSKYDCRAILANFLNLMPRAHNDAAATRVHGSAAAGRSHNQRARRKVRTGNDFQKFLNRNVRILDQRQRRIHDLAQIVRRNVRRHAHRDAAAAVDQQVWKTRRQNVRLKRGFVIVRMEIDRILVDILKHRFGGLVEPRLGITHGGRAVAVHRTKVALSVDQRKAHRKRLRHADHCIVNRAVAMRVVFTHHVTDDTRRFTERLCAVVAAFLHRIENAAVNGFQTVTHVRKRARHDDAHRIGKIRLPHLVFDSHRRNVRRQHGGRIFSHYKPCFFSQFARIAKLKSTKFL